LFRSPGDAALHQATVVLAGVVQKKNKELP